MQAYTLNDKNMRASNQFIPIIRILLLASTSRKEEFSTLSRYTRLKKIIIIDYKTVLRLVCLTMKIIIPFAI